MFLIIGLKENVPYVVKAASETFINSEFIKYEILNCLELLITDGLNVRAASCDNHAANVSTFTKLIMQFGEDNGSLFINLQSQKVYLFYDIVHLIKIVRNNLLRKKRLVFPQFSFFEFNDGATVNPGEISWKLFHHVYENDQKLDTNLRKTRKLTNKVLHPGKYKQNGQLALDIFYETTVASISFYFPVSNDAIGFLNPHMHKMVPQGPKYNIFGNHFYSKNARKLKFHVFLYFFARKDIKSKCYLK